MKIKIKKAGGFGFIILLPSRLVFSPLAARLFNRLGKKYEAEGFPHIPPKRMGEFYKELKKANRRFGKWYVFEAVSPEGDEISVRL